MNRTQRIEFDLTCNYQHIKEMFALVPFVKTADERFFIAREIGETSTRIEYLRERLRR